MKKVSKGTKIRIRFIQVQHLTKDTNGKLTNSHLDTTNQSQEVSPFPAGDHKAQIKRWAQRHNKHKTEKHRQSTKEVPPWKGQQNILLDGLNRFHCASLILNSDVDKDKYIFQTVIFAITLVTMNGHTSKLFKNTFYDVQIEGNGEINMA